MALSVSDATSPIIARNGSSQCLLRQFSLHWSTALKPEHATYPPLDVVKPIAPGIWIVDSGPLRVMGIPVPVRMTVIQLVDGGLLLHSPTRFDFDLRKQLEQIGAIEHLVAPNSAHWSFVKEWQSHVPGAVTWAAPGLRHRTQVRRSGVRIDHDLAAAAPEAWSKDLDQVLVPGAGGFNEVALYHKSSRTLVLTDLVLNLEPEKLPFIIRPAARLLGVTAPVGKAPVYLRMIIKWKREAAKAAAERLVAFQPKRVIFSHGQWFHKDGAALLRQSLDWLL
jgi:hypothetical protein